MISSEDIFLGGMDRVLNEREREILRRIVHLYILKASPIGSRFLSKFIQDELKLSPATLRNVMSDLEELNYISHPHTSAGRIPTDKGYRFYVDSLSHIEDIPFSDKLTLQGSLKENDTDSVLKNASKLIGMLSKYLAVVQIPKIRDLIVEKLEIIPLSSSKLLVVLALDSNIVRTVTLEADFEIDVKFTEPVARYINERISGKPLKFLKDNFIDMMTDFTGNDTPIIRLFTDSLDKIFVSNSTERVLIAGTQNLLEYPEFEDLKRVRSVIELVENEDIIVHLLEKYEEKDGLQVLIGKEMNHDLLEDYSMIKTTYQIGSATGSIGLIGPKRMNYSKMITLIKVVSDILTANPE